MTNEVHFEAPHGNGDVNYGACGLTKREYFAAVAMQGLLANENGWYLSESQIAQAAIAHADALIVELNKENQQ